MSYQGKYSKENNKIKVVARNANFVLLVIKAKTRAIEFFGVSTKMTDLTFLPMLYIWTDASILSYVKMLPCAKDLIPDICGQHLNTLELYKY